MPCLGASKLEDLPPLNELLGTLLRGPHGYTRSFWEDVQAFVRAVDWNQDRWLFLVFAFEAFEFLLVVGNCRHWERNAILFMINGALLALAERINGVARRHWKQFSSQQYFDESGAFITAVVGFPLIACQFLIVILLLKEAAIMVVKVKRLELRRDLVSKSKQQ
mmetsp:Transcript_74722/g.173060  ORF Transcript_74722/g.173060 Transcript_74722/m.173060 type:complete len:164 (-) Transcript_74722:171-662(-)